MIIEHRPCPRCQVPHTARFADGIAVCFNCRATWQPEDPEGTLTAPRRARQAPAAPAAPDAPAQPEAPYQFTARELARLATYRAAVAAGFYNEGLDEDLARDAEREAA
jgi:hypothetical protein